MFEAKKLLLFSAETMLRRPDTETFRELRQLLLDSSVGPNDSWVLAHSLIFRLLLFTKERRLKVGLRNSLANPLVRKFLLRHGFAEKYQDIIAE